MTSVPVRWLCVFALAFSSSCLAKTSAIKVFFWYGCPACSQLEEALEEQQLGHGWQRLPAFVHRSWRKQGKWYAAFRRMNLPWENDKALMQALAEGTVRTDAPESLQAWMLSRGLNYQQFADIIRSREVNEDVKKLKALAAKVRHVPSVQVGDTLIDAADYSTMTEFLTAVSLAVAHHREAEKSKRDE